MKEHEKFERSLFTVSRYLISFQSYKALEDAKINAKIAQFRDVTNFE